MIMIKKTILRMAAVALLGSTWVGCGNNNQSGDGNATEDAMLDNLGPYVSASAAQNPNPPVFLSLVKWTETDSSMIYVAKSLREQDTIGVQVEINKEIPAGVYADGEVNEEKGFTEGTIKFSSIGEESDSFVKALAALYDLPEDKGMTSSTLEPIVFSSNKTVTDLSGNGTYSFKLSFENNLGEGAEAFATLDLFRYALELRATNEEQYPLILSAFTGE